MKKSKYSEDQIVKILQEAEAGQTSHVELCKRHGIGIQTFYIWRAASTAGCRPGQRRHSPGQRPG